MDDEDAALIAEAEASLARAMETAAEAFGAGGKWYDEPRPPEVEALVILYLHIKARDLVDRAFEEMETDE